MSLITLLIGAALALDCAEVRQMLDVRVPSNIVIQTIEQSGGVTPGTEECLRRNGAPAEVVAAARREAEAPSAPPAQVVDCANLPALLAERRWADVHACSEGDGSIAGRYRDGVALALLGRRAEAIRAFAEVLRLVQAHHGTRVTRARADALDVDRDLAILAIARVYYGVGRYAEAAAWYARVPRRSPFWARAQLELAWAEFYGSPTAAWERLMALREAGAWSPELVRLELLCAWELYHLDRDLCRHRPGRLDEAAIEAVHARARTELAAAGPEAEEVALLERILTHERMGERGWMIHCGPGSYEF